MPIKGLPRLIVLKKRNKNEFHAVHLVNFLFFIFVTPA